MNERMNELYTIYIPPVKPRLKARGVFSGGCSCLLRTALAVR